MSTHVKCNDIPERREEKDLTSCSGSPLMPQASQLCRSEFEDLASSYIERASQPLLEILDRNQIQVSDLTAVELLGGGSRVPAVKKALSDALGGRQLDM